jgi:hypothetical protein
MDLCKTEVIQLKQQLADELIDTNMTLEQLKSNQSNLVLQNEF